MWDFSTAHHPWFARRDKAAPARSVRLAGRPKKRPAGHRSPPAATASSHPFSLLALVAGAPILRPLLSGRDIARRLGGLPVGAARTHARDHGRPSAGRLCNGFVGGDRRRRWWRGGRRGFSGRGPRGHALLAEIAILHPVGLVIRLHVLPLSSAFLHGFGVRRN